MRNIVEEGRSIMESGDLWSSMTRKEHTSDSPKKYKAIYVHKRVDEGENDRRCAIKET